MKYLSADNGCKMSEEDACGWIANWGMFLSQELGKKGDLMEAIYTANKKAGFRCCATEVLLTAYCEHLSTADKYKAARYIADCAVAIKNPVAAWKAAELANVIRPGIGSMIRFFFAEGTFNIYAAQYEVPSICFIPREHIKAPVCKPANAGKIIDACKSTGQSKALATLAQIAKIRHEFGGQIAGIPIRASALLLGPSGSGKTWVARQFAAASGWPLFSTTVSSWIPAGAKSEPQTMAELKKALGTSVQIVFVDECDKIKTRSDDNSGWYRSCVGELMLLLDRTPDIVLTAQERANLDRSWVICAGAFQDIYRAKLGGQVNFAEELEDLVITRADLEEHSGLPTELLNRLGLPIHIAPPTAKQLSDALKNVEDAVGFSGNEKARMAVASEMACELKGFRGLEEYAISCARSVLEKQRGKSR